MIKLSEKSEEDSNVDLTSLVDVIFILIVFLLLMINTSAFQEDVDLPVLEKGGSSLNSADNPVRIVLRKEPPYYKVNSQEISDWPMVKDTLEETLKPEDSVIISLDKDLEVQKFLDLMLELKKYKLNNSQINVKRDSK